MLEEWTKKVAEEHKSHWYFQLCSAVKHKEAGLVFNSRGSLLSSRMQAAEAELLYIKEVEKLDGFGQETFPAKVGRWKTTRHSYSYPIGRLIYILLMQDNYTNDIFIGVSFIGVFVKHRNGRSIMLHK